MSEAPARHINEKAVSSRWNLLFSIPTRQRQHCHWLLLVFPFMLWIAASQSVVPGTCHNAGSQAPLQAP